MSWHMARLQTPPPAALVAVLLTGAGMAALAQPLDPLPRPATPATARHFAAVQRPTTRITLPTPAFAPAAHRDITGTAKASRLAAPAAAIAPAPLPEPSEAAIARAAPATVRIAIGPAATSPATLASRPPAAALAAARGPVEPSSSPDLSLAASSVAPLKRPIPMVDDATRASLGLSGMAGPAPGAVERVTALAPVEPVAHPLAGSVAPRAAASAAAPDSDARHALKQEILARIATLPPDAQKPSIMSAATKLAGGAIRQYQRTPRGLTFAVTARLNGADVGAVSLLIRDGANISVRLADLLGALRPAIEPALYERLSTSQAADDYMTFNELRAAGISVRFDDGDELLLGSK